MPADEKFTVSETKLKSAAHDLRNILGSILHSAESIKSKFTDEGLLKLVSNIENSAIKSSEIIERLITPEKESIKRNISLNVLISELYESFKVSAGEKIEVEIELPQEEIIVKANYTELYRALQNLLINAAEAITDAGTISLRLKKRKSGGLFFADVEIKDSGCGIPEKIQDKIFNEGFSTKSKKVISGIGLYNVKKIIEDNSAVISFNSESNIGTTFVISLPVALPAKIKSSGGKKILIVDDEEVIRELLTDLFTSMNFETSAAANGKEAIELVESGAEFDIIIIDKYMPEMNGAETILKLRESGFNKPIILSSGSASGKSELKLKSGLIQDVISKPFQFDELSAKVNKYI